MPESKTNKITFSILSFIIILLYATTFLYFEYWKTIASILVSYIAFDLIWILCFNLDETKKRVKRMEKGYVFILFVVIILLGTATANYIVEITISKLSTPVISFFGEYFQLFLDGLMLFINFSLVLFSYRLFHIDIFQH